MNSLTKIFMTALATLISSLLCFMHLNGCVIGTIGDPPERQTPAGCLKSQARYFDPKAKQCVTVTTQGQARRLNAYRYVNELADKNIREVEYAIYFKKYKTVDEAEALWSELRSQGAKMVDLNAAMPDHRKYDPEEWEAKTQEDYSGQPRIWGKTGLSPGIGWQKFWHPNSTAEIGTIKEMLLEGLQSLNEERPRPELTKAVLEGKDDRITSMDIRVDAKAMVDWLNRHYDELEGVQPLVNFIDRNQDEFIPLTPTIEGE